MINSKLPTQVEQVLLGSLFGDGGLVKKKSRSKGINKSKDTGVSFQEGHSLKQKDYLIWKKTILSQSFIMKQNIYGGKYPQIRIYSLTSSLLKNYYKDFYPYSKNYKGIKYKKFSLKMLNKLKPLGLAIWYMDDGCFQKRNNTAKIGTHKQNVKLVKKWFMEFLNIKVRIYIYPNLNGAEIVFNKEEKNKLFRLIHPYIIPSMKYKIKQTREDKISINRKNQTYRQKTKEEKKERGKKYYQENKEKRKEYYQRNRVKILMKKKKYRQKPESKEKRKKYNQRPEVKKKRKEYRQKNKDRIRKRTQKYLQKPEVKKRRREYMRKYQQRPEVKEYQRDYRRIKTKDWE